MRIGVDYYPEQWDRELWEKDAEIMARTGVKLVRIGEAAWSRIEKEEGVYDFSWLDDVIGIFSKFAMGIILCIPTNCPPLWLYEKYPEIIRRDNDGKPLHKGVKGRRCINSEIFSSYAKKLTEQVARHFANNNAVAAWQIDNEIDAYPCTCESCRNKFRNWLSERFETTENLNKVLGANVYNGEYSDISQVEPPDADPGVWRNPALCLEWYRFVSSTTSEYVREIATVLRRETPRIPVTTNVIFSEYTPDLYKLNEMLDMVAYDNYPPVRLSNDSNQTGSRAFELDLMRGIKGRNFWIMEQLSGPTDFQVKISPAPKSRMIMGYALQAMVRGAEAVLHFRWRTALTGHEMFCHGILDHSNVPNRRFSEFLELCRRAGQMGVLDNTKIISDIAILYSPETEAALRIQPQTEGFDYMKQLKAFHTAFTGFGANVDVVSPTSDLSGYKVVVVPSLFVNNAAVTKNIYRFVINGGTAVFTTRSGVKDENNNCIMDTLPTVFKELIGAQIIEYDPTGDYKLHIKDFAGNEFECSQWCDMLQPSTAKAYAEYSEGEFRCMPAVTMNRYCSGVAYYIGTVCSPDFYKSFVSNVMMQTGIPKLTGLPEGVEVTTRANDRDEYICFFNNSEEHAVIPLPKPMYSVLSSTGKDSIELKPYDMDIVRK